MSYFPLRLRTFHANIARFFVILRSFFMSQAIIALSITAASIGFFHTLFGPDHYVPFIVMGKARKWSVIKTLWVTLLCGIGHVGSSIVLGLLGVGLGIMVGKLELFEGFRGNLAGWLLLSFGLVYFVWGLRQAFKNKPHKHFHSHSDGIAHEHTHKHIQDHSHVHDAADKKNITPWILFTIFVLGPCEPLIPILMYPAAQASYIGMFVVTGIFALATISTMLGMVLVTSLGLNFLPIHRFEKYMHALAGATIFMCGFSIQFLGL
jgi:nickel/cobalt transporter (NicO) family protein